MCTEWAHCPHDETAALLLQLHVCGQQRTKIYTTFFVTARSAQECSVHVAVTVTVGHRMWYLIDLNSKYTRARKSTSLSHALNLAEEDSAGCHL